MSLQRLPTGSRVLQPGEIVCAGDYLQIGTSYHLVHDSRTCRTNTEHRADWDCGGIGHVIVNGGTFETYWTDRDRRV